MSEQSFQLACNTIIQYVSDSLLAVIVAVFGGVIHSLNNKPDKWSWGWFLTGLLTAAFAGLVMDGILEYFRVTGKIYVAILSMAGFSANDILIAIRTRLVKEICGEDTPTTPEEPKGEDAQ